MVYRKLSETSTGIHVYGVPDRIPGFDVAVHGPVAGISGVVVRLPVPDDTGTHAALVAMETGPRTLDGFLTFDPTTVTELDACIRQTL